MLIRLLKRATLTRLFSSCTCQWRNGQEQDTVPESPAAFVPHDIPPSWIVKATRYKPNDYEGLNPKVIMSRDSEFVTKFMSVLVKSQVQDAFNPDEPRAQNGQWGGGGFEAVRARLLPAVKADVTGKVHVGKRGEWHSDIAHKRGVERGSYDRGYYDPLTKSYISREDLPIDSTELLPFDPIKEARRMPSLPQPGTLPRPAA
jgi:hypothetical protein